MPKFKKNTSPAMKKSAYKMRYQGSHSAFPFKSPLQDHEKDEDGNVIEHETELIGINPSDTTTINRIQIKFIIKL